MKKRYILVEFLIILIFLLLPPLFVHHSQGISKAAEFSPAILCQFIMAAVFQLQFSLQFKNFKSNEENINAKKFRLFKNAFWWSITLGCLMLIFALMQTLTLFFERDVLTKNLLPSVGSALKWIFLIFTVFSGAFYEEVLYRQFIPETAFFLLKEKNLKKPFVFAVEIAAILIFAFSHRYLGWIPVLNAFACGCVLRLCYKKTSSVWTGTAAHFFYNMILIIFSLLA